jgi:hypothetical protein
MTRISFLPPSLGSFTLFAARLRSLCRPKGRLGSRDMAIEQRIIRIVPTLHLDYRFVTKPTLCQTCVVPPHRLLWVVWDFFTQKLLAYDNHNRMFQLSLAFLRTDS